MITFCPKCKPHDYQDKKLGFNVRYANQLAKNKDTYRCTVCGNVAGIQIKPSDWDLLNGKKK